MTLSTGSKLGPYEILGQIGAGGMGEAHRAKDPRLWREVMMGRKEPWKELVPPDRSGLIRIEPFA